MDTLHMRLATSAVQSVACEQSEGVPITYYSSFPVQPSAVRCYPVLCHLQLLLVMTLTPAATIYWRSVDRNALISLMALCRMQ